MFCAPVDLLGTQEMSSNPFHSRGQSTAYISSAACAACSQPVVCLSF